MPKYSIGLDIGTNSVGWAVVDENNQLVKKNGFTLWGVRMFDQASDASKARSYRTDRRRLERRKYRVKLLRDIFYNEIIKIDPTFFERLDDSFYKLEDKRNANFHNLFNDSYTDKDFFNDFPTIYHLRKYLCDSSKKEDIRFIYLALHNMVKYRGNFLNQGDTFNKGNNERIKEIFNDLNSLLVDLSNEMEDYSDYFVQIELSNKIFSDLTEIILSKKKISEKKKALKELFNVDNKTLVNECIIPLLVGTKCNFSNLLPVKDMKYEKCEILFSDENLENTIDESKGKVPEMSSVLDFVTNIKEVVDYYFLIKLLQDSNTLSESMIKKYDEHKEDLDKLKRLIKNNLSEKYNECFRIYDEKINNYVKYVGFNSTNSTPKRFGHCSRDAFYTYLQSLLKQIKNEKCNDEINYFINKIENNDLLLRQNSDQNGSIPMQLNLMEMKTILNNQKEFYPFLNEKDNEGISNVEKIISIFKFIIPYYIGPLNPNSKRSWVVRSDEKIYPWNFDKVVDVDESAKKFIQNMQRKCTYLKGEKDYCLPKKSIAFSKYNCLSYLNKLSINGALIPVDVKNDIFNNVFLKIKKPTRKDIINYLICNYGELNVTTAKLKELPELNCDMASYVKFNEIFGGDIDSKIDLIEQIIKDIVIFSDKKILEKRLLNVYKLDKEIVKKIKDLNYKDYSNLSNKLLNELKIINPKTGELQGTVLDIMTNTNLNLQEILYSPEYRLIDVIDKYNNEQVDGSVFESVEDFLNENVAVSPEMKRPLIQAHTIISEVKEILKAPIDKYYVECTRTNKAEKKQTVSRYSKLKELYSSCKKTALDYNIDLKKLESKLDSNKDNLKSDLLYLYFTQLGKCMYSLEDIDLEKLVSNNNMYDIDHIYPQSLIKDDSFSNRVLVKKELNNAKQDNLLFEMPNLLNKKCFSFYEKLKDLGLISKEKYRRLTKKELTSGELEGFVNRQLVSTNQAVKGLIQVLKTYDKVNSNDIVYSKAENISLARQLFDLPKSRTANNFHHAHDAYLNVVIGRVINDYFIANHFIGASDYYRLKAESKTINVEKILKYDKWKVGKEYIDKNIIINMINKNLYQRYDVSETTRTNNPNELFSKVTIKPAKQGTVPIKMSLPLSSIDKYGGITSYSYCKYIIIETINKQGGKEYILEPIPKAFDNREDYYLQKQGFSNFNILHNNIKANVVIEDKALKYSVTGKTSDYYYIKNLHDRYFDKKSIAIIKKIDKYNNNILYEIPMIEANDSIVLSPARNYNCDEIVLSKGELIELVNNLCNKYQKISYSYSAIKSIHSSILKTDINSFLVKDLVKLCTELLKILKTNERKLADLKLIGLSSNSGAMTISKRLTKGMKIISESVTGYYRKVLFEVPE